MRASFKAKLPAYGYQVYAVAPTANPNKPVFVTHPHNVLENEHLRIQITPNGTFIVEDKASGQVYRDQGYFEDGGDNGDGYNYSYPLEDRVENTLGAARASAGWRTALSFSVPASITTGPYRKDWMPPDGSAAKRAYPAR